MGLVLLNQEHFPKALAALEKAVELSPKDAEIRTKLATALLAAGNTNEGLATLKTASGLGERNADIQFQIGEIYQAQEKTQAALAAYKKAAYANSNFLEPRFAAAEILLEQQDYLQAIIIYRRVIGIAPDNAVAHYKMGLALKGRKRQREALRAFETALKLFEEQDDFEGKEKVKTAIAELEN